MDTTVLFKAALGINDPWYVEDIDFRKGNDGQMELHITLNFYKGSTFLCPIDGCHEESTAYDTVEHIWRHMNFFQYRTYIHAPQPRTKCKNHGVHVVSVPWARTGSGFTLLFEAFVLELSKTQAMSNVADQVGEHDTRLWRFVNKYVSEARELENYSEVSALGMDETSKKGHNYMTVMVDLEERKVIYATEGKDNTTVDKFVDDFKAHSGYAENIKIVTCDMSLGFRKGINNNFPNATTVIDKFHVIKHANEAVDAVRKEEVKTNPLLKKTKYIWLKNSDNLTEKQSEKKERLSKKRLKTGRAYSMRVTLQDIYETSNNRSEAEPQMKKLYSWLMKSRLEPMRKFAGLLKDHWKEILNYFEYRYTNAILEGMNSIIQNIKCRARGFKNDEYFKTMIYLVCGKLKIDEVIASYQA